jgi:lipopolysaccharide/colanic/teichoic acid biosynthesis glycosyltransferase
MIRLFRVFIPASTLALLVFETGVILSAFIASTYLLDLDPTDYLFDDLGWVSIGLVSLSVLAGVYLQDLYSQVRVRSRLLLAQQLLMAAGIAFLLQALISAVAPNLFVEFPVVLAGCSMSVVTLFAGRLLFSNYVVPRVANERLLLLGDSPLLDDIATYLERRPQLGIQVVGHIREPDLAQGNLEETIQHFRSKRIVVAMPGAQLAGELLELRFLGYSIEEAAGTYAKISSREALSGLGPSRLMYSREFEPSARDLFFQAIANTLVAAICLIVFSPLILLIAILAFVFLPGPVLERHIRSGRGGVPFTLYCFQTPAGSPSGEPFLRRILSRTGLYALPQFFNVLRGDLSIVGPRPQRPEFIQELTRLIPFYPHRSKTRPGMTGLAQIEMRTLAEPPDIIVELEYDMYYLKYMSPMVDLFITLQNIKNILIWGGRP